MPRSTTRGWTHVLEHEPPFVCENEPSHPQIVDGSLRTGDFERGQVIEILAIDAASPEDVHHVIH